MFRAQADLHSDDLDKKKAGAQIIGGLSGAEQAALSTKFLTDSHHREKMQKSLEDRHKATSGLSGDAADEAAKKYAQDEMDHTTKSLMAYSDSDRGKEELNLDDSQKDLVEDMKTNNLHLIEPKDAAGKKIPETDPGYNTAKQEAIKKHLEKRKLEGKLKPGAISPNSLKDNNVRLAAESVHSRENKDGKRMSVLHEIKDTAAGTDDQRKAIRESVTPADIRGPEGTKLVSDMVSSGSINQENRGTPRLDEVKSQIGGSMGDEGGGLPRRMRGAAMGALLDRGYSASEVLGSDLPADSSQFAVSAAVHNASTSGRNMLERTSAILESDLGNAHHFDQVIPTDTDDPDNANDLSYVVATSASKESVKKLHQSIDNEKDPIKQEGKRKAVGTIHRAVNVEVNRAQRDNDNLEQQIAQINHEQSARQTEITRIRSSGVVTRDDDDKIQRIQSESVSDQARLAQFNTKKKGLERDLTRLRATKTEMDTTAQVGEHYNARSGRNIP